MPGKKKFKMHHKITEIPKHFNAKTSAVKARFPNRAVHKPDFWKKEDNFWLAVTLLFIYPWFTLLAKYFYQKENLCHNIHCTIIIFFCVKGYLINYVWRTPVKMSSFTKAKSQLFWIKFEPIHSLQFSFKSFVQAWIVILLKLSIDFPGVSLLGL